MTNSKLSFDMMLEMPSTSPLMRYSKDFDMPAYDESCNKRKTTLSGFLIQNMIHCCEYIHEFAPSRDSKSLDLDFLTRNAHILASSKEGIIVFEGNQDPNNVLYHVCKPTTKQVLALPIIKTSYLTVKVMIAVVDSDPLHYKIVRLSQHRTHTQVIMDFELHEACRCEIFDSMEFKWRLLDPLLLPMDRFQDVLLIKTHLITTKEFIYMLSTDNEVWKFDIYLEQWDSIPSPILRLMSECYTSVQFLKYEEKLGLVCKAPNRSWEIWAPNVNNSWVKIHVFNEDEDFEKEHLEALCELQTSAIMHGNELVLYKFKGHKKINKVALLQKWT
ncbi:F-box associated interaction domain, Leucine-rich repeat domain, L domain-like protein [Artemisia annua]|uniref:F-box associated interaction domain, Leucine-rich repeat domain, L domain-like protein n=1 Tax=Artemisia annua TaxID=35608 RepID=A0A2U1M5Q9_ARTAN|nr:F-box associated interaction domain, Leucine-rich repeat domain, L domain-like protein [Artemisia annua]